METAGYSKTSLAKKLGIKSGFQCLLVNAPDHYFSLFKELPEDIAFAKFIFGSAERSKREHTLDFIHLFSTEYAELEEQIPKLKPLLKKSGMLWVSWPKGSSKIKTDVKREPLRAQVLASGLVDIKVCAVDNDWSALKFVIRLEDR